MYYVYSHVAQLYLSEHHLLPKNHTFELPGAVALQGDRPQQTERSPGGSINVRVCCLKKIFICLNSIPTAQGGGGSFQT